jgi:hypothetical protein
MKKLHLLLSADLVALCAMNASAAETAQKAEPKNNIKLYGFIRNYLTFDSRESVSGTGDLFYYLPKDVKMNEAGTQDLNAASSFRFLALTSRLGVDVTGYSIENVHFGAKIEADFYSGLGSASDVKGYFPSNTKISGTAAMRLRQAYATVTWKELGDEGKNSLALKMGQAWHPMGADFPHVFSLEIGAPFGPFSRTPLVQADYNLGKNWTLTGAALTQMQYNSQGPVGTSPLYMKYGMTPEIYAGLTYKSNGFLVRGGVDVLSIKPRYYGLATVNGVESTVRVADRKTSVLGFVFTQYTKDKFSVRAKSTFGQGGEHMNLMTGYAKIGENPDGSWEYASLRNTSSWLSLSYGKKWQGVFFLGYMKNLGLAEAASAPLAKADVYFCGNGFSNINQIYRINPQLIYNIGKMNLGVEYQFTSVQYGEYDGGKLNEYALAVKGLHWVGNHRVNMMIKYNF